MKRIPMPPLSDETRMRHRSGAFFACLLVLIFLLSACSSPQISTSSDTPEASPEPTAARSGQDLQRVPTSTAAPAPTAAPTSASAPTAAPTAPPSPALSGAAYGNEVLFLREGVLTAYDLDAAQERQIAPDVREFTATPDGETLALVRDTSGSPEIWMAARDGSDLRQLTTNDRVESGLSLAPDGLTLAYAAAPTAPERPLDWTGWVAWCSTSEIRVLDSPSGAETTLEPGCDPAFAPDGRRIAFATPPTNLATGVEPGTNNTIRLVNRQGENGWSFATATGDNDSGRLVYAPTWSPTSSHVGYQRFVGYQALVDMAYTEMGNSFEGGGMLLNAGAGWLRAPRFSPDGSKLVVTEYNYSDARGFTGYDVWTTRVLQLGAQEEIYLPSGPRTTEALKLDTLSRATGAAWSPDASALVVALPTGWDPTISTQEPAFSEAVPGELWRWEPGDVPNAQLAQGVDYASPLLWLPPAPQVATTSQGDRLVFPVGWQLAPEAEVINAVAPDGIRQMSMIRLAGGTDLAALTVAGTFAFAVGPNTEESGTITWPDGSVYHGFTGTTPDGVAVAGAMRALKDASDATVVLLYRTAPQVWALERAQAQALLAAGGQ